MLPSFGECDQFDEETIQTMWYLYYKFLVKINVFENKNGVK